MGLGATARSGNSQALTFGCHSFNYLASQELYTVQHMHHSLSPIHTAIKRKKKRWVRCNPLCSTTAFSGHSPFVVFDCGILRTVADPCGRQAAAWVRADICDRTLIARTPRVFYDRAVLTVLIGRRRYGTPALPHLGELLNERPGTKMGQVTAAWPHNPRNTAGQSYAQGGLGATSSRWG